MSTPQTPLSRRQFAVASLTATAAAAVLPSVGSAAAKPIRKQQYCAFVKYMTSMSYDDMAAALAEAGFDGVEVNVRSKDGYVKPEQVAQELPKLDDALRKANVGIFIVTTDILSAEQLDAETTLRVAADLGVPRYRLGF